MAIGLYFIEINAITKDKLLIAIFGGLTMGAGVGLVLRCGGVIDGAEVIAVLPSAKLASPATKLLCFLMPLFLLLLPHNLAWKRQCILS